MANDPSTDNTNTTRPQPQFAKDIGTDAYSPPDLPMGTYDLSTSECADNDSKYIAQLMAESLNIAGGPANLFPLLGVHSQGSTIDQTGDGFPLASGTLAGYNALDAFNVDDAAWRSSQTGADVLTTPAYIGYDFGTKKAWNNTQERYYPAAPVRKQIMTLKIRQNATATMRALQVRVEASDDGVEWKRIDVLNLTNTDQLVTVGIRATAAYNKWRFIPIYFTGVASNSSWEVNEIHLLESNQISLDNIEDFFLLENRDRSYCRTSTLLKCQYDLLDVQSELARFGISLPQTYIFTCSFAAMVKVLGRPVVVGDIVELPGEVQYDATLKPVRKWLEVTDTAWSTEGYTPNWKPNLFKFYAEPIQPSVEHRDILGLPGTVNTLQSDSDLMANGFLQNQLAYEANDAIKQFSDDAVPQTGSDPQDIQSAMSMNNKAGTYDGNDLYVEDALPPNGADFTVGDTLPAPSAISDGHYHRQTYSAVPIAIRPPDRLLRWFADIQRWKVIEINTRATPESHKKTISKIMSSANKLNPDTKV